MKAGIYLGKEAVEIRDEDFHGCFLYAFLAHAECGDGTGK